MKAGRVMRVARPTPNLTELADMYIQGLGFKILSQFTDHDGFDGIILGHPGQIYHLEFTSQRIQTTAQKPSQEQLLVFYIPDKTEWENTCEQMLRAGFKNVRSFNPYWDVKGKTFIDLDGCPVVLQQTPWGN